MCVHITYSQDDIVCSNPCAWLWINILSMLNACGCIHVCVCVRVYLIIYVNRICKKINLKVLQLRRHLPTPPSGRKFMGIHFHSNHAYIYTACKILLLLLYCLYFVVTSFLRMSVALHVHWKYMCFIVIIIIIILHDERALEWKMSPVMHCVCVHHYDCNINI